MRLEEYLKEQCIVKKKFAEKLEVTAQTLDNIISGSSPRLELALKIEQMTGGKVKPKDLLPPPGQEKKKRKAKKDDAKTA